jgi:adenosylcobinamide-GDP ribazoletransferase
MEAEFLAAVSMLTRLPVRNGSGERTGAAAYAIVGSLVGLVASVPLVTFGAVIPPVAAGLAIASIAVVTGVIHLDGLADTADALVALGPDGAERARSDPAVGVGGVVALLVVLGLEATSLAILLVDGDPITAGFACVLAGGVSRGVPVVLVRLTHQRAQPSGLGGWFAARTTNTDAGLVVGSAVVLGLACLWVLGRPAVLAAGGIGGIGGLALGMGLVRLRGQVDGDLLGASIELSFVLTLVIAATLIGGLDW